MLGKTVDICYSFLYESLSYIDIVTGVLLLKKNRYRRVVWHYHSLNHPWEDLRLIAQWNDALASVGITLVLYTGPFGSDDRNKFTGDVDWIQKSESGSYQYYGSEKKALMMCPLSEYFEEYRLPVMLKFLYATGSRQVFLDIPWLVGINGCECWRCNSHINQEFDTRQESIVHEGLKQAIILIRKSMPYSFSVSVNAAAHGIWNASRHGVTPMSLSNITIDEFVTEWSPRNIQEFIGIDRSLDFISDLNPKAAFSHAYIPNKNKSITKELGEFLNKGNVSQWHCGLENDKRSPSV